MTGPVPLCGITSVSGFGITGGVVLGRLGFDDGCQVIVFGTLGTSAAGTGAPGVVELAIGVAMPTGIEGCGCETGTGGATVVVAIGTNPFEGEIGEGVVTVWVGFSDSAIVGRVPGVKPVVSTATLLGPPIYTGGSAPDASALGNVTGIGKAPGVAPVCEYQVAEAFG